MLLTSISDMGDQELKAALDRLARSEREATASLVAHLAEFDARRLYEGEGFSSAFTYCRSVLKLVEGAAYNRILAARMARRYPVILDRLAAGSLCLTTVRMLAPHLTAENHESLLSAADGKGKRDVERLLASWFPQPDVATSVRKLPQTSARPTATPPRQGSDLLPVATAAVGESKSEIADPSSLDLATGPAVPPPTRPSLVRPLSAERYEIRFTASADMLEKLRTAQDLLGHAVPSGDLVQVFDRALTRLVADLERKKFALTSRPRTGRPASADASPDGVPDGRDIPAAVKRGAAIRDRARCAFVSASGRRCEERRFLEFHHVVPHAAGGPATLENIQLRCRAHNGYAVDQYFGPGKRRSRVERVRTGAVAPPGTRSGTSSLAAPKAIWTPSGG